MAIKQITVGMVRWNKERTNIYALTKKGERIHMKGVKVLKVEADQTRGVLDYVTITYDDMNGTAVVHNYGKFERQFGWRTFGTEIRMAWATMRKVVKTLWRR